MNKQSVLQLQSINAAKKNDWEIAIEKNQELLSLFPEDIGARNRLGVALLQLKKTAQAKAIFEEVLTIDKSNQIARKHLANIKNKKKAKKPSFTREQFIEEPGTTKIIELHRLASKAILESLDVGQKVSLQSKSRYVSIETEDGIYIGALPEDLSFRLTKLIKRGNTYEAMVHSANETECHVYIKEGQRSKKNENINSFPLNRTAITAINDVDERFLLENDIPVAIVSTDDDNEKTIDDIDTTDED